MANEKGFIGIAVVFLILIGGLLFLRVISQKSEIVEKVIPTPTPYQFPYKNPTIVKDHSYRIVIVGDSIVHTLGLNANTLREALIRKYPDKEFVTYNYGYPSTNVLSLYNRLESDILNQGFDLIIIESFGYNPLSEYQLADGLQKQNEALEKGVRLILNKKPNTALAFLTPIAPDPLNFGRGILDLSAEQRKSWVEERISYINNHRKFAEDKGIPIIDTYKASLKENGEVNRIYISDDSIHPSKEGVGLISQSIADYIWSNSIFPK